MNAIVSADNNWGIGNRGDLLIRLEADMRHFRRFTEGSLVVMGRKTFESLPGRQALDGRLNIVLSSDRRYEAEGAVVCPGIEELFRLLECCRANREVFVIGGEIVFRQLLPYCERAVVTRIYKTFEADRFFPNLDKDPAWIRGPAIFSGEERGIDYETFIYARREELVKSPRAAADRGNAYSRLIIG